MIEYQLLLLLTLLCSTISIPELSSKTVYDATRGDVTLLPTLKNSVGQCKPERIYTVLRHGSRNFGSSTVDRIDLFLDKLEKMVKFDESENVDLAPEMAWYRNWTRGVYFKDYELVPEGMMEHYSIAKRFKQSFPNLFPSYSISNYSIQATTKMRTVQSALSYMAALLEDTGPLGSSQSRLNISMSGYQPPGIQIDKNSEDKLLRFVDCCPKYENYINTLQWKNESKHFEESSDFISVIKTIAKSFNFEVTIDDVKALYYLCAAELMSPTQAHHSQFCNVFDEAAFSILDFDKSLEKYYKYSYPFKTTYQMSCVLLQNIIMHLESNETTPIFKFAHEETLLPLFSLMGMFDDGVILTHEFPNYTKRKMMTGQIVPFAANIAFIKHSCPGEADSRVQVIVNERDVYIPLCSGSSLSPSSCTVQELKQIVETRADGCNFSSICNVKHGYNDLHIVVGVLFTVVIVQATYIFLHCINWCPGCPKNSHHDHQLLLDDSDDNLDSGCTSDDIVTTQFGGIDATSNSD